MLRTFLILCFLISIFPGTKHPLLYGQNVVTKSSANDRDEINLLKSKMHEEYFVGYSPSLQTKYPINGSWSDINYNATATSEWVADRHWDRLNELAKAFINKKSIGLPDTDMLPYFEDAVNFWNIKKPVCSNYWWNAIGVPLKMGQFLLLMDGHLSSQSVEKVLHYMRLGIKDDHYEYYGAATGQNQVWLAQVHSMIGMLEKDTVALRRAFSAFHDEVYLSTGEGIQYDYSFFQHGHQLYSGGYGIGYTKDIARLIKLANGTSYQFPAEKIQIFSDFLLQGQQWVMYKNVFDYSTMGREISRLKNADSRVKTLIEVCEEMASLNVPLKNELMQMASSLKGNYENAITGNKHFWRGDLMVHRTPRFYTSIKMTSDRIKSSEWGNKENEKSFYLGQGVQLLMRRGDEYKQIFPIWDWQKLPGTLAEQRDTIPKTAGPWGDGAFGKKPFTGGVSNGKIGFAVNDYELENVKAKRAWFCFANEIVVMGAGIENHADNPLLQTINQCYLNGPVWAKSSKGKLPDAIKNDENYLLNDAGWVFHDSIAYIFPEKTKITVSAKPQKGSWKSINGGTDSPTEVIEKNVFSASIDLGKQVTAASFMYAVVPGISKLETENYQLPVRAISNTKQQQALWHSGEKTLMAVFYQPGTIKDKVQQLQVDVDMPVLLLLKETIDEMEVSVANPLNKGGNVKLNINRKLSGDGCEWSEKTGATILTLTLPTGNYAGQTITRKFMVAK